MVFDSFDSLAITNIRTFFFTTALMGGYGPPVSKPVRRTQVAQRK